MFSRRQRLHMFISTGCVETHPDYPDDVPFMGFTAKTILLYCVTALRLRHCFWPLQRIQHRLYSFLIADPADTTEKTSSTF